MATKNRPGPHDCYANAHPDEPMFVLLGRDPDAPSLVEQWADRRRGISDPAKVQEARDCAAAMREWLPQVGRKERPPTEPLTAEQVMTYFAGFGIHVAPDDAADLATVSGMDIEERAEWLPFYKMAGSLLMQAVGVMADSFAMHTRGELTDELNAEHAAEFRLLLKMNLLLCSPGPNGQRMTPEQRSEQRTQVEAFVDEMLADSGPAVRVSAQVVPAGPLVAGGGA